jgi:hypothetical protein
MVDRVLIWPGQVPLETDLLNTNRNTMTAIAKLSAAVFGTAGMANGFATTQSVVPAMTVLVASGEVYQLANLDSTAYSSLAADTTHSIVKQGLQLDPVTVAIAAPGTAGFSINYLIEVAYQDSDTGLTVLPYYNASNPSVAYSGPANSGVSQPTKRAGIVSILAKAGVAATTGTQTTPSPDSGYLGLYVVTVANGASTVLNANISAYASAPILATPAANGRFIGRRVITSTQVYVPTPGTNFVNVTVAGGGGGGGGAQSTGSGNVASGAGGGGGGWAIKRITAGFAGVTITVGAGGAGGIITGASGNGQPSSFGALVSAGGGAGGPFGPQNVATTPFTLGYAGGGGGSGGDVNFAGGYGGWAFYAPNPQSGKGGSSYGGEGGIWVTGYASGGSAVFYGGGGGGGNCPPSNGGATGGAGYQGVVIIEEYS